MDRPTFLVPFLFITRPLIVNYLFLFLQRLFFLFHIGPSANSSSSDTDMVAIFRYVFSGKRGRECVQMTKILNGK